METGRQLRVFSSYKWSKSDKDVASEDTSESEHMHLLNTPEVHQRSVLNPSFSDCCSGSIKDSSLVTKPTSTK